MSYKPIQDYAIIGDLNTVALVSAKGSIDFLCYPRFDSPSIFAALLDREKGGAFKVSPLSSGYNAKQMYVPDTNVLLTRFLGEDSVGEIIDFMPAEDLNLGKKVIRRVSTIRGEVKFRMICAPRFNYGKERPKIRKTERGVLFQSANKLNPHLKLSTQIELNIHGDHVTADFTLKGGESISFILFQPENGEEIQNIDQFVMDSLMKEIQYWRTWLSGCNYQGRWRETVYRSALVLKLLTSERFGSMVAAPTFSLPEKEGGQRNWDYRFTWIRDSSFSMYAFLKLGYNDEADKFINWIENHCQDLKNNSELQVMYKIDGNKAMTEGILEYMEGYKHSHPVRIGNKAGRQFQLDIYGELLNCVYLYDRFAKPISYEFWKRLTQQLDWLCNNWQRKDNSIWEVRAGMQEFLFSRVMCWVAFDRAIKIANNRSYPYNARWLDERDKIFEDIHKNFWDPQRCAFVQYKGGKAVDASSLMMPIVEFISPQDPKWLSTLNRIEEELVSDSLVYRYSQENAAPDGMQGHEGTFNMCTFWYVQCLAMSGQVHKARFAFEKMLSYANHVGLYSEQLGMQGEALGNFPQAFSHMGLISAAWKLDHLLDQQKIPENSNYKNLKSFLT